MIKEGKQVVINDHRNANERSSKSKRQQPVAFTYRSSIIMIPRFGRELLLAVVILVLILLVDPASISVLAMRLSSTTTKTTVSFVTNLKYRCRDYQSPSSYNNWMNQNQHRGHRYQQLYYKSQQGKEEEDEQFRAPSDDDDKNTTESNNNNKKKDNEAVKSIVTTKNNINDDDNDNKSESESESVSSLLILQEQAAKLRMEAELLQLALQETKNQKIKNEREKVDQWIEDLFLIQQSSESNTNNNTNNNNTNTNTNDVDILKNVDQVYQYMILKRFSSEQIYKIFNRLSDIKLDRSQGMTCESRSNCSPLMSLLLDAACKLDCTEKDENPNKRWNYKIERILQKKLFARDWNIEYIADDEPDQ
jgi:hypothetical protein